MFNADTLVDLFQLINEVIPPPISGDVIICHNLMLKDGKICLGLWVPVSEQVKCYDVYFESGEEINREHLLEVKKTIEKLEEDIKERSLDGQR